MMLQKYANNFLHLFFPQLCMACDSHLMADEEILCTECLFHFPETDFHLDSSNETARQLWGKIEFEHVFSMLNLSKSSRVERLLHRLK